MSPTGRAIVNLFIGILVGLAGKRKKKKKMELIISAQA
jgi:hypothetical protein